MKEKKRHTLWGILLLCVVLSVVFFLPFQHHDLQTITEVIYHEGVIYGSDQLEGTVYIFQYDVARQKSDCITIEQGTVSSFVVDQQGILHTIYYLDGEVFLATVCFEERTLEIQRNITELCLGFERISQLEDGSLTLMTSDTIYVVDIYTIENHGLEFYKQLEFPENHNQFFFGTESSMAVVDILGTVYLEDFMFLNDGTEISMDNYSFFMLDRAYFENAEEETIYYFDEDNQLQKNERSFHPTSILKKYVYSFTYDKEDDIYVGLAQDEENINHIVIYGGMAEHDFTIHQVERNKIDQREIYFKILGSLWLICGGGYLIFSYYIRRGTGIPVTVIMPIALLPLYLLGYFFVMETVRTNLWAQTLIDYASYGYSLQGTYEQRLAESDFEAYHQLEALTIDDSYALSDICFDIHYLWYMEQEDENFVYLDNFYTYFYKEEEIYGADSLLFLNTSLEPHLNWVQHQSLETSFSQGIAVAEEYITHGHHYFTYIFPVKNQQGTVLGGMQLFFDAQTMKDIYEEEVVVVQNNLQQALMVMYFFTWALCYFSMSYLGRIRLAAYRVTQGDLVTPFQVRGHRELSRLGNSLNGIRKNLQEKLETFQKLSTVYQTYFTEQQFKLLHEDGVRGVSVGDSAMLQIAGITIGKPMTGENFFAEFNQTYGKELAMVAENQLGIIHLEEEYPRISIFDREKILDIATAMEESAKGEKIYLSIIHQHVKIGVIGTSYRKIFTMISQDLEFAQKLQELAQKFDVPVMITGRCALQLESNPYQMRILGYIKMQQQNKYEVLYQVLTGTQQENMRIKLDTRALFEEGVSLFMAGKLEQGLRKFIQVLAMDENDLVAQDYVLQCENRLKNPSENREYYLVCF